MEKIFIASMNLRGKWAELPDNCTRINVTSAQSKKSIYRIAFSPMSPFNNPTNKFKDFYCFENYWQSGKRFEGINDIDKQLKWWKDQKKGRRKYPPAKNKKVLHAIFPGIEKPLSYVPSRKLVYIPEYYNLIKDSYVLKDIIKQYNQGTNFAVYDFDGPRGTNKEPICCPLTLDLLKQKVTYERDPFGHGYIVAAAIMGYKPDDYIKN